MVSTGQGKLSVVALCTSVFVAAVPANAFAQAPPDPLSPSLETATIPVSAGDQPTYVTPNHLAVDDQVFEASVSGFRAYLETKRVSDPRLFAQLDPKVAQLESRVLAGRAVFVAGLVLGLASTGYAIFGRKTCTEPAITDPSFAADSAAWGACNDDNVRTSGKFGLLGVGAIALGGLGWWIVAPKRSDLFDLVNANNSLSRDTIRLQIGFDPTGHLATGGFATMF
jgi:hypothetical protein